MEKGKFHWHIISPIASYSRVVCRVWVNSEAKGKKKTTVKENIDFVLEFICIYKVSVIKGNHQCDWFLVCYKISLPATTFHSKKRLQIKGKNDPCEIQIIMHTHQTDSQRRVFASWKNHVGYPRVKQWSEKLINCIAVLPWKLRGWEGTDGLHYILTFFLTCINKLKRLKGETWARHGDFARGNRWDIPSYWYL